jgi:hypothetical protein
MRLWIFGPLYLIWRVFDFLLLTLPSLLSAFVGATLRESAGIGDILRKADAAETRHLNEEHADGFLESGTTFNRRDN